MGEFKSMTKMETTEPSVILKLKKGGSAKSKDSKSDAGHKPMNASPFAPAESGKAPGKPSMMERRKAMMPNLYAKGGNVVKKAIGGAMPGMGSGLGGVAPMGANADTQQLAQAMAAQKMAGLKSGGGVTASMTKTTVKPSIAPYAKGKLKTGDKHAKSGGKTGEIKEGKPAGYAVGGTISGNEGKFKDSFVVTGTNKTTGPKSDGVRMGNDGGYADGGKVKSVYTHQLVDRKNADKVVGQYKSGVAARTRADKLDNAYGGYRYQVRRIPNEVKPDVDVAMADGGKVSGGDWENKPANTGKPGKVNTTTGEVKKANDGGYKKGGATKKPMPRVG